MKYTHKSRKPKKTRKSVCSTNPKTKSTSKKSKTLKKLNMSKLNKKMYGGDGYVNDSLVNNNTHQDKMNEILEKMVKLNQKIKQIENMMETQNKSGEIKPEKDEVIVQITSGKSMVESGVNLQGNNSETVVKMVQ